MSNEYFEGVKERFKLYFPLVLKSTGIGFVILLIIGLFHWEYQVNTSDGGKIYIKKENVKCKKIQYPKYTAYNPTMSFDTGRVNSDKLAYRNWLLENGRIEEYKKEVREEERRLREIAYRKKKYEVKPSDTLAYECSVKGVKENLIGNESIYKKSNFCFKTDSIPCKAAHFYDILSINDMVLYGKK